MSSELRREVRLADGFVVRAVKRGDTLIEPGFRPDPWEPASWFVAPLFALASRPLLGGVRTWKVGVLRHQRRRLGSGLRLLHRERLAPDEDPGPALERLAADVRAGRFGGQSRSSVS